MDLLRFSTAGSVDDGKSTLIGRLLFDSKGVFEDQLEAVARSTVNRASVGLDLSLLTDGLRAEREQGITIDVAYRYFATPRRKFIIADTPGHEQYTRNMATGASTADLAIVLIDARHGALVQSRRHTFIAALLGIPHVVVAVNKMDLVDWSEARFEEIHLNFKSFTESVGLRQVQFVPLSALLGDNVVDGSTHMPWYRGPSLLHHLETVAIAAADVDAPLRFPIQLVIRPNLDFRGFAGQIAAGSVRVGDEVVALPSNTRSKVARIHTLDGDLQEATAPESVTVLLEDEIDVSRGDMLVRPREMPWVRKEFDAHLVWMDGTHLDLGRPYLIRHTSRTVRGRVAQIQHRVDVNTLQELPARHLSLNEIGRVRIAAAQPLYMDPYPAFRRTGCFVLVDPLSNSTVAAGMVCPDQPDEEALLTQVPRVDRLARQAQHGHRAMAVVVRGGDPGWRAHVARELENRLFRRGVQAILLDEDFAQPAAANWSLGLPQIIAALAERLIAAGQVVVVPLPGQTDSLPGVAPPDLVWLTLTHGEAAAQSAADSELQLDTSQLEPAAAAAKAVTWLTDRGLFGLPAVVSRGAGI